MSTESFNHMDGATGFNFGFLCDTGGRLANFLLRFQVFEPLNKTLIDVPTNSMEGLVYQGRAIKITINDTPSENTPSYVLISRKYPLKGDCSWEDMVHDCRNLNWLLEVSGKDKDLFPEGLLDIILEERGRLREETNE